MAQPPADGLQHRASFAGFVVVLGPVEPGGNLYGQVDSGVFSGLDTVTIMFPPEGPPRGRLSR